MIDISNLHWHEVNIKLPKLLSHTIPSILRKWLFDTNSLTQNLKSHYPQFNVQVINETCVNLNDEISAILNTPKAIKREVYLCSNKKRLVYAISFIPQECDDLLNLGNTPLGEVLFNTASRKNIEITITNGIVGRRSIFMYKSYMIVVCEFFITTLKPLNKND